MNGTDTKPMTWAHIAVGGRLALLAACLGVMVGCAGAAKQARERAAGRHMASKVSFVDADRIQPCNENQNENKQANPSYWQYRGRPLLLLGGSVEDNLFQIPDIEQHLDLLASVGGNYVRCTMSSRDPCNVWPFEKDPATGLYDLNKPGAEYWRRFARFLDLTAAREHLSDYTLALTAHIREEEEVLLPAYEELNVEVRGGGAHLYRAEHQKIHWWLGELDRLMTKLEGRPTVGPREVLAVLDRECTFSHLMGHHDLRERSFLYPILDASLTVEARAHLWAGIRACRMEGNS